MLSIVFVEIVLKLDDSDTDLTILDCVLVKDPLLGLVLLELVELVAWLVPVDTDKAVVEDKLTFFGFISPCSDLFLRLELIVVIFDEFMEEIASPMLGADLKLLVLIEEDRIGSFMDLLLLSVAFVASWFLTRSSSSPTVFKLIEVFVLLALGFCDGSILDS